MKAVVLCFMMVALASQLVGAQQCSSDRPYDPYVCKFSGMLTGLPGSGQSSVGGEINQDPLGSLPVTGNPGVSGTTCEDAVRSDGNACVTFYAEYQCSFALPACNQKPCASFCTNAPSTCPTAADRGCFGSLEFCASDNTGCTKWNIDKSKLPSGSTTTSAGSTTTRTHTTTTSDAGSFAPNSFLFTVVFLMVVCYIANSFSN